jgi:myb proto-oncogene protein
LEEDHLLEDVVSRYGPKKWKQIAAKVPGRKGWQCRKRWLNALSPDVSHNPWTEEEDNFIIAFVEKNGHEWSRCAKQLPNRTDNSIENRWYSNLSKRQENQDQHSENLSTGNVDKKNPSFPGKRTKKYWQENEDELLWNAMKRTQNWKQIATKIPGRTAKQCRDRWIEQLNPFINHGNWTKEEDQLLIEQHQLWGNKWAKIAQNFPNRTDNQIKNRWNIHLSKKNHPNPQINQPSPESWGTVSSFDFFDYSFDTENGD